MPPLLLAALLLPAVPSDSDASPNRLGTKVAEFTLTDTSGKPWNFTDVKDRKAFVVVFVGTECPLVGQYLPRLAELQREYEPKGVAFLAVNSNSQDKPAQLAEQAKKHALPFPVLKDATHAVADQFAAQRTPEAFVLDAERVLRYRGRIDDQYGIGFSRPKPTRRDLAAALDEVLAGKPVSVARTETPGCLIGRVVRPKAEGTVTYTRDVAPILQRHCQECHRPQQIGPMALLTYEDASAWSETIREVVQQKRMPPWLADPKHGHFENDRSLPGAERDKLLAWIEQGCPKGDEKDLPKPASFADEWRIGKPDAVFTMKNPYRVAAKSDRGIRYQYFFVSTNFDEDRWIQAAEARPGNRAVVHHIIVYVAKLGERPGSGSDGIGNGFLVGYAPGDMPAVFAPGTAKKLPKGAMLVFQMHYTPTGTEERDQSSVGLIFAKDPPKQEVRTKSIAYNRLSIPPGESNYKVVSRATFREDAMLYSLLPHMHLRGKSFEYRVFFPDGKEEVLLSVPRWDFNWQSNYRLQKPLALPAGTRIECTAFFDNSEKNLNNPDPTKEVRWGEQTWQEMMIGFVDYANVGKAGGP